jgi:hypothetical protein
MLSNARTLRTYYHSWNFLGILVATVPKRPQRCFGGHCPGPNTFEGATRARAVRQSRACDSIMNRKVSKSQLRVRVGRNCNARFNSHHGQRNAELIAGPQIPLPRWEFTTRFDSLALLKPGYDLIHSSNAVPILTRCPFMVTFGDYMPRICWRTARSRG